ncbi:hypothetical protein [Lutibaculum baratangense]|uniref:Uncharacterized protein n=1 Tax=Lutibaculum baratangense AMV1 TaxID=631454 RepID=V4RIM9_9HYPH|nr:hypothetical protein [Lutibaculum baratangense]ESR25941.1 hypothetical protein N177_1276 [Lutibaculum baratangense AMV1]
MTFLPLLVINFLLASFAAHFALRYLDSERSRRIAMPARVRHWSRARHKH